MPKLNWLKIVPTAALILIVVLGFNPLLKFGLEKAGDAAFGARTEIGRFSLNLFTGRLKIDNLSVANKRAPMTNLFEVSRIRFGLETEQLFYKRTNIPAVTIDHILLGTPRKKSGALPAKPPRTKPPLDLNKMARNLDMNPAAVQNAFTVAPPKTPAEGARIQKENTRILSEAQKQIAAYDVNKELAALNLQELNGLSLSSAEDLQKLQTLLAEKQKGLNAIAAAVEANRAAGDKALRETQKNLAELDRIRRADIDNLLGVFNLANYDLSVIGRELLGPKINNWIDTGLEYWTLAQKYMPPKKDPPPKKERFRGTTIVFPNNKTRPRFWLGRLGLSGVSGQGTSNELAYHGYISDIASEQYLIGRPTVLDGRPTVLDIQGAYAQRPNSHLAIKGIFDRRNTADDSLSFTLSGFDLAEQQFWSTDTIPLEITGGLGIIAADVQLTDGNLSGKISFVGRDMRYKPLSSDGVSKLVAEAIAGVNELRVDIALSGKLDAPNIRLLTNLDAVIKARLEKEISAQLEHAKAQLLAEYDKAVGDAQAAADKALQEQTAALQNSLTAQTAALEAEKDKLSALQKELEKQANSQIDAAKKQAEDALKKALPGLKF